MIRQSGGYTFTVACPNADCTIKHPTQGPRSAERWRELLARDIIRCHCVSCDKWWDWVPSAEVRAELLKALERAEGM